MNKKIEELEKAYEETSKNLEEMGKKIEEMKLEEKTFKVREEGVGVDICGAKTIGSYPPSRKRGRLFNSTEQAEKVDDIISPSYFIAQYVMEKCPEYKPDWGNSSEDKYFIVYDNYYENYAVSFNTSCENKGVVYMTKKVSRDLCNLLNNNQYKLEV